MPAVRDGCQDGTPFSGARFRFLAANVVSRRTGARFPPYAIRKLAACASDSSA